ncbi:MAG TPA: hypothetical protein VD838_20185 [Anaeromyxobacteraceae bacterium]|nr:hypothetical protein [Anaeromyxobacteraceae bacterium]
MRATRSRPPARRFDAVAEAVILAARMHREPWHLVARRALVSERQIRRWRAAGRAGDPRFAGFAEAVDGIERVSR